MPSPEFSVRASSKYILFYAFFFPLLVAGSIWYGLANGSESNGVGRIVGLVPFGPQIVMIFMVIACVAGLAWLVRIRPPRPLLWLDGRTLVAEGVWGRRRCDLADISRVSVVNVPIFRRLSLLEIERVRGRNIRVGLRPAELTWRGRRTVGSGDPFTPGVARRAGTACYDVSQTGRLVS
jgi:hypothetical protein